MCTPNSLCKLATSCVKSMPEGLVGCLSVHDCVINAYKRLFFLSSISHSFGEYSAPSLVPGSAISATWYTGKVVMVMPEEIDLDTGTHFMKRK